MYRQSNAYKNAMKIARAQRRAMRYRVGTLENVPGVPLKIRTRRTAR